MLCRASKINLHRFQNMILMFKISFLRLFRETLLLQLTCRLRFYSSRRMAISKESMTNGCRSKDALQKAPKWIRPGSLSLASGAYSSSAALQASLHSPYFSVGCAGSIRGTTQMARNRRLRIRKFLGVVKNQYVHLVSRS